MVLKIVFLILLCIPVLYLSFILFGLLVDQVKSGKRPVAEKLVNEKVNYGQGNRYFNETTRKRRSEIRVVK